VIVNRVWQHDFGSGLVGTSSDFGRLGESPSHPELLDWLAIELATHGWRLKQLHRLILTSATYRQASQLSRQQIARARRIDPDNRLHWKHTARRLDAEEIRDAMLAISGELEPLIGGPSVASTHPRRAIDTHSIRNRSEMLLDAFDAPDGSTTTAHRNVTTTATQALLLINGEWSVARAAAFARRLLQLESSSSDERDRLVSAYRLAFGRRPDPDELRRSLAFLAQQAKVSASAGSPLEHPGERPDLMDFCHALLNSSEFLYVD
jgi:hypothetical protein